MVPLDRKEKLSLLKSVFSGTAPLSEYLPKAFKIVIGVDGEETQFFINENRVDQAVFYEVSKKQQPGPITVNVIDTD
jgi:hypothetical protein